MHLVAGLLLTLAAIHQPATIHAQTTETKLALRPVDQAGDYFDLVLRPGEARDLTVDLANLGEAPIRVRTYASDVYTIIDGGFGARLRDGAPTGTTTWLDYPTAVIDLAIGGSVHRPFSVRVPVHVAPGEYATSIILENETPTPGSGAVKFDQVNRQAVAVLVTVPGPREPGIAIGAATHKAFFDISIVSIAVSNTGNVRLKPVVEFTLFDSSGKTVRSGNLAMDTFYAHTDTKVEFPFDFTLPPGAYTVDLALRDTKHDAAETKRGIPLTVSAEGLSSSVPATDDGEPGRSDDGGVQLLGGIAILTGLGLGIVACMLVLAVVKHRSRRESNR